LNFNLTILKSRRKELHLNYAKLVSRKIILDGYIIKQMCFIQSVLWCNAHCREWRPYPAPPLWI